MKCAYCNNPCGDRPVRYEAVCWACHWKAVRDRDARRPRWLRWFFRKSTDDASTDGES